MNLKSKITNSPTAQAIISIFSIIVAAIIVSWFMIEINVGCGKLDWAHCYKFRSFKFLVGLVFVIIIYYRYFYEFAKESLDDYKDKKKLQAIITKECLPDVVKQTKRKIREQGAKGLKSSLKEMGL